MAKSDPRSKAQAMVAKAVNKAASPEEARTAAMKACAYIAEHNLLDVPKVSVAAAVEAAARAPDVVARAKEVATDPEVRTTIAQAGAAATQIADAAVKLGDLFGQIGKAARKVRGRR